MYDVLAGFERTAAEWWPLLGSAPRRANRLNDRLVNMENVLVDGDEGIRMAVQALMDHADPGVSYRAACLGLRWQSDHAEGALARIADQSGAGHLRTIALYTLAGQQPENP